MTALGTGSASPDAHESADLQFGKTEVGNLQIANYNILQKLAVGGMAELYLATREGQLRVVKRLHSHLSQENVVGSRFMREAQVASHLLHPHIARITDFKAMTDGQKYLAMEYIAGQDVESMMFRLWEQRKMLPPELSMTVTLAVLEGLDYAHSQRGPDGAPLDIVHRDLSPRNVMVTYDGHTKIIDFGLARTNLGDFRTAPGMVLGTLRYMSPEQAVAEPVDRRSDIYSWAVVLYEMLSGRPLVTGGNAPEVLQAVVTAIPPPLSTLNPNLPKALDAVVEKGLAKDRRDRWKTAREFKDALIKAAGPLAVTDDERLRLIGQFVRELFPLEHQRSVAMIESARTMDAPFEPTAIGSMPNEVTRAVEARDMRTMVRARDEGPLDVATLVHSSPPEDATRTALRTPMPQQSPFANRKMLAIGFVAVAALLAAVAAIAYFAGRSSKMAEVQQQVAEPAPRVAIEEPAVAIKSRVETREPPLPLPAPDDAVPPEATPLRPTTKTKRLQREERKAEPTAPVAAKPAVAAAPSHAPASKVAEVERLLFQAGQEDASDGKQGLRLQEAKDVLSAMMDASAKTLTATRGCMETYNLNPSLQRLRRCFDYFKRETQ